jgi:hypothetical protein
MKSVRGLMVWRGVVMAGQAQATKLVNVRLPAWAIDFVDSRSAEAGITKTQVVIEAISCLREEQVQALMREGYEEMSRTGQQLAEEDLAAVIESLPAW